MSTFFVAFLLATSLLRTDQVISNIPCEDQVATFLNAKLQKEKDIEWVEVVDAGSSGAKNHFCFSNLTGEVFQLRSHPNEGVTLQFRNSDKTTKVQWDLGCRAQVNESKNEEESSKRFTNKKFFHYLTTEKTGVLFFWSPTMPLSGLAYSHLAAATKTKKLGLLALVDPWAKSDESAAYAKLTGIPINGDESVLASSVLVNLGVTLHYPTLIVFKNGRISTRHIPGYKEVDTYERMIEAELRGLEEKAP